MSRYIEVLLSQRDERLVDVDYWEESIQLSLAILSNSDTLSNNTKELLTLEEQLGEIQRSAQENSQYAQARNDIEKLTGEIGVIGSQKRHMMETRAMLEKELSDLQAKIDAEQKALKKQQTTTQQIEQDTIKLTSEFQGKQKQYTDKKTAQMQLVGQINTENIEIDKVSKTLLKLTQKMAFIFNEEIGTVTGQKPTRATLGKIMLPKVKKDDQFDGADAEAPELTEDMLLDIKQAVDPKKHSRRVTWLCFAHTQPYFASGAEDSNVIVTKTDNFTCEAQLHEATKSIMSLAFSPSDRLLVSASYDSMIRFYNVPDFNLTHNLSDNVDCVNDIVFLSENRLASCARGGLIKLYDLTRMTTVASFTSSKTSYSICGLQGESLVVTADFGGTIRGWDFRTQGVPLEMKPHKKKAIQIIGNGNNMIVTTLSTDETIAVSDFRTLSKMGSISIRNAGVPSDQMQMAVSENIAITGSSSGDLYFYDLNNFSLIRNKKGHNKSLFCIAHKPSIGLVATGDASGTVKLWSP